MTTLFKDHFSTAAENYASHRPTYPRSFVEFIVSLAPERELVWDCATGNGQAAVDLARYFKKVIATDASEAQIANAKTAENIEYRVAPAEFSGLENNSVDLITVATAVHWFDFEKFYTEVKRVGKPNSIIAVWALDLFRINPEIDRVIDWFYHDVVGSYWPPERNLVDTQYKTIPFPFTEIGVLHFIMSDTWTLKKLLAHVGTWSSVIRFREVKKEDPIEILKEKLNLVWDEETKSVSRKIFTRAGFIHGYPKKQIQKRETKDEES